MNLILFTWGSTRQANACSQVEYRSYRSLLTKLETYYEHGLREIHAHSLACSDATFQRYMYEEHLLLLHTKYRVLYRQPFGKVECEILHGSALTLPYHLRICSGQRLGPTMCECLLPVVSMIGIR